MSWMSSHVFFTLMERCVRIHPMDPCRLKWKCTYKLGVNNLCGKIRIHVWIMVCFTYKLRSKSWWIACTPPKFNIAPEKWWLEDEFPFGIAYILGAMLKFPRFKRFKYTNHHQIRLGIGWIPTHLNARWASQARYQGMDPNCRRPVLPDVFAAFRNSARPTETTS